MNYDDPRRMSALLRELARRAAIAWKLLRAALVNQAKHMIANPKTSSAGIMMLCGAWGAHASGDRMTLILGGLGLLFAKDAGAGSTE